VTKLHATSDRRQGGSDYETDLIELLASQSGTRAAALTVTPMSRNERFERFHEANPAVYAAIVSSARSYRRQTGRDVVGMSLLFGRVRWVLALATDEADPGLNDHYQPFYARLIMARESDLAGMFAVRSSHADAWITDYLTRRGRAA
jgi:hypothetical protein